MRGPSVEWVSFPEWHRPFLFPPLAAKSLFGKAKQMLLKLWVTLPLPTLGSLVPARSRTSYLSTVNQIPNPPPGPVAKSHHQISTSLCREVPRWATASDSLTRLTARPRAQNHGDEVTETALCFLLQGTWSDVWFQGRR